MAKLILCNAEKRLMIHENPPFFTSEKAAWRWLKKDLQQNGYLYRLGEQILLLDISRLAEAGVSDLPNDLTDHTVRTYEIKWSVHDVTALIHKKQFGR